MAVLQTDVFGWNLKTLYSSTLVDIALAGIQLFMWIYMITRLGSTPTESKRARMLYIVVSFILLSLSSVAAVFNAIGIYRVLFEAVPGDENVAQGWEIMDRVNKEVLVYGEVVWSIAVFTTDTVLVYRCYTVWFHKRWVSIPPILLLITNMGLLAKSIAVLLTDPTQRDRRLDIANIFISVFLHLIITALICGRLLHAHRKLSQLMTSEKTKNPYLGTMSILIESAAPLALFGIGTAITVALPPYPNVAKVGMIFQIPYKIFMTMSLQLIIFRIAMGWSWAEERESKILISQEMKFADFEAGLRSSSSFDDGHSQ